MGAGVAVEMDAAAIVPDFDAHIVDIESRSLSAIIDIVEQCRNAIERYRLCH